MRVSDPDLLVIPTIREVDGEKVAAIRFLEKVMGKDDLFGSWFEMAVELTEIELEIYEMGCSRSAKKSETVLNTPGSTAVPAETLSRLPLPCVLLCNRVE